MIPHEHAEFLSRAVEVMKRDPRIVGVACGGSYLNDGMDEYSDLDLVVVVAPEGYEAILSERETLAESLGPLLSCFTGEHVGEPRLLICLYGPVPLLHVDLKFVALSDLAQRVEDPAVLWERNGVVSGALAESKASYPPVKLQWIEDRFWVWVHYGATKIGRGELHEAVAFLTAMPTMVLGPMGLQSVGARPAGVRKIEFLAPELARQLQRTIPAYSSESCVAALFAVIGIYRELREKLRDPSLIVRTGAESAAIAYLDKIVPRVSLLP